MFKPVIKWSGSKRSQSSKIKEFLPDKFNRYYEPFVGGGSMLYAINPPAAVCGDICVPLIDLWNEIKNNPVELSEAYKLRWTRLQTEGYQAYYEIRDDFNKNRSPEDLLFLSRSASASSTAPAGFSMTTSVEIPSRFSVATVPSAVRPWASSI